MDEADAANGDEFTEAEFVVAGAECDVEAAG